MTSYIHVRVAECYGDEDLFQGDFSNNIFATRTPIGFNTFCFVYPGFDESPKKTKSQQKKVSAPEV